MKFIFKIIRKTFGDQKIKTLSLHPLLEKAVVLKTRLKRGFFEAKADRKSEEKFLWIKIKLLSLQSAKTKVKRNKVL